MKHIFKFALLILLLISLIGAVSASTQVNYTASKGGVFNGGFETGTGTGTAAGWVGSENYGWYGVVSGGAGTNSYDANISHSGTKSLKISTPDASTRCQIFNRESGLSLQTLSKHSIPLKPSTTYRISYWYNGTTIGTEKTYFRRGVYDSAGTQVSLSLDYFPAGSYGWTPFNTTFTTESNANYLSLLFDTQSGQAQTLWLDDITLEEVVQDTYSGTSVPVKVVVQGVTSVDNIDVSKTGSIADNAFSSTIKWQGQQFQPIKTKITGITIPLKNTNASQTGTLTFAIETDSGSNTPSGTILASNTVDVSTLTSTMTATTVNLPVIYSGTGKLWVTVKSSWGTAPNAVYDTLGNRQHTDYYAEGLSSWTNNYDYQLAVNVLYAKNTEDVAVTVNGVTTSLISNGTAVGDATGLLSGAIVDTDKGMFSYEIGFNATSPGKFSDAFSSTAGGYTTAPLVINGWGNTNTEESIQSASDTTARSVTFKLNTMLNVTGINVTATAFNNNVNTGLVEVSGDNVNYNTVIDYPASASAQTVSASSNFVTGNSTFYVRLSKDTANGYIRWDMLNVTAVYGVYTLPTQTYINGVNYVNISSNGRADSASLDPSMMVNVWLMAQAPINNPPTVIFSTNITSGVNPLALYLNDTSTESPTYWNTSWGESPIPSWTNQTSFPATNITHVYSTAGSYTITHYATNAYGTGSATATITVYGFANSQFSSFNTAGTAPFTTYLYDTSTNTTGGTNSWYWKLGDGNVSTAQNLYYTWNITGTYSVNHSFSNGLSTNWNNKSNYVTVGTSVSPPVAAFYGGPQVGAPPLTVFFNDISTNTPTSWNWSYGDGFYGTTMNPTHIYSGSGFFTVNLTATNSAGSDTESQTNFVMVY